MSASVRVCPCPHAQVDLQTAAQENKFNTWWYDQELNKLVSAGNHIWETVVLSHCSLRVASVRPLRGLHVLHSRSHPLAACVLRVCNCARVLAVCIRGRSFAEFVCGVRVRVNEAYKRSHMLPMAASFRMRQLLLRMLVLRLLVLRFTQTKHVASFACAYARAAARPAARALARGRVGAHFSAT
eukprot:6177655-Pleurochrysis_carterae.AAC.1